MGHDVSTAHMIPIIPNLIFVAVFVYAVYRFMGGKGWDDGPKY